MTRKRYPASKDRRDIGEVVFPIEKMMAAREISSCCVGIEAALETNSGLEKIRTGLLNRLSAICSRAF